MSDGGQCAPPEATSLAAAPVVKIRFQLELNMSARTVRALPVWTYNNNKKNPKTNKKQETPKQTHRKPGAGTDFPQNQNNSFCDRL